ncbi:hypothetical protein MWH03_00430 [Klebsiella pneumoniae]|nr:hypothetical protein [Klebsiella pneumoniae]
MPWQISFVREDGKGICGSLRQTESGSLTFEGDADAAAQCFFRHVINLHDDQLRLLQEKLRSATDTLRLISANPDPVGNSDRARDHLSAL